MMGKQRRKMYTVAFVATFLGACGVALAADPTAQLGKDPRNQPSGESNSPDFGFTFYTPNYVEGGATDICTTIPKEGDSRTLMATGAAWMPENPDPIRKTIAGSTVTFNGRTGECYYIVTGRYVSTGSGGADGTPPTWEGDFDSSQTPHFTVYVNDRVRSDDDWFYMDEPSYVTVELHSPVADEEYSVVLSQQSDDGGAVSIDADSHPIAVGSPVSLPAFYVSEGLVTVIASAAPLSDPVTQGTTKAPAGLTGKADVNIKLSGVTVPVSQSNLKGTAKTDIPPGNISINGAAAGPATVPITVTWPTQTKTYQATVSGRLLTDITADRIKATAVMTNNRIIYKVVLKDPENGTFPNMTTTLDGGDATAQTKIGQTTIVAQNYTMTKSLGLLSITIITDITVTIEAFKK